MVDSFIIYTPNPPSISTLPSSGKQTEWKKTINNLKILLENYKKNDFNNQESELFDFIDKSFEEMNPKDFYKNIKNLMEKIKDDIKLNNYKLDSISFNSLDRSVFNLTFKNIFLLVDIIIHIIENTNSKGKIYDIVYDFVYNNKIPSFKDEIYHKQQLSKLFSNLNSVQTIKLCLYEENEDINISKENKKNDNRNIKNSSFKMDSKIVFFFSLFYKSIFKSAPTAIIDLNIIPIDNYFINNNNPYLINEEQILNLADYYKDIIICNLIFIKSLSKCSHITNLNFIMYDSYQIELHNILTNTLNNGNKIDLDLNKQKSNHLKTNNQRMKSTENFKKNIKKGFSSEIEENLILYSPEFNNNYLYIQHILNSPETSYFYFCLDFNSLDPLLFNSVNYLLTKFTCIAELKLILFPHKKFNKRKIYFNSCYYNKYLNDDDKISYSYSSEDNKIYYQYLEKNDNNNNNFILKDEKLLNELFFFFNMNLRSLSIILEKKINELLKLSIDFSTYNNESISLYNYDNYNCSIICFIFDLFKTFQLQIDNCKINSLNIFYDDFLDEKSYVVETIKKKIPSCRNGFKLNNLKLNQINFNISNISLFLPFENFPSVNLTELIISNLSYNDLNNLVNSFHNNENLFPVLIKLDVSLGIMVEDYNEPLKLLLKDCIPLLQKLVYFNLNLPFNISIPQLIDILYWIKSNHNIDLIINLKIFNSQLNQCINQYYFKNCVIDLFNSYKDYFKKRNILPNFDVTDGQIIKFIINKYNKKDIDYFYKFIFCFEKSNLLNKKIQNQNIYENIFNFRGKFKKYEVNIEIIN